MKIKTEILQEMIAKAIQGASNNKLIPLTSLIGIEVNKSLESRDKSYLILTTTDGSNQFKVQYLIDIVDDFYTIVNADTFSKLVGKTTKEFIELENKENYLLFTGNGDYKLELAINEEGEIVKFPEISIAGNEYYTVNTKALQNAINTAKSSVAKTMEVPCLTGYYIADKTIATDRQLACVIEDKLIPEPLLISSEIAELILLIDEENINIYHEDNNLLLFGHHFFISGKELEGKELYPVKAIEGLTKLEYTNNIKVNRQELLNVLDRMSLFVTDYEKNGIYLAFTKEALLVKSQRSNAQELIDAECSCDEEYNVLVDIEMLKSQLESLQNEDVTIYFGQDKSIELKENNTILVLSLVQKTN